MPRRQRLRNAKVLGGIAGEELGSGNEEWEGEGEPDEDEPGPLLAPRRPAHRVPLTAHRYCTTTTSRGAVADPPSRER